MIRIRYLLYKVCLTFIFGTVSFHTYAQITMGAKGLGMGQATTALPGYDWALFANPALLNNDRFGVLRPQEYECLQQEVYLPGLV